MQIFINQVSTKTENISMAKKKPNGMTDRSKEKVENRKAWKKTSGIWLTSCGESSIHIKL
ncbi:hypothetical protein D1164_01620 [Mariniphaga sediminis]|uniref:Uncharacterized protein n=1 Tax=Mariniphaga sediminis TaxID=1628158 RepID=A0A399D780_9BACT|nr:hypothetical protein D1164_01620 [Mariniphaga sediminis]